MNGRPARSRRASAARDLGHLHQRQRPLHHPRAAGAGNHQQRLTALERHFHRPGDLFAHDDAHAAADERILHRRDHDVETVQPSGRDDDGVFDAGRLDRRLQAVAVQLGVSKTKRVVRGQVREVFGPFGVKQRAKAIGGADTEMVGALGADMQVGLEILVVKDLRTVRTLDPQSFGHPAGLLSRGGRHRLPGLLKPGHRDTLPQVKSQKSKVKVKSGKPPRPRSRLQWSGDVVARAPVQRPDLPEQVVDRGVAGGEVELRGLHDQERRGRVVKEEVLVGLVQLTEV